MFQGTGVLAFNATFYLQQNPDVLAAISTGRFQGTALDHFVQFGQFEGRDPNQFFDTEYYLANNTDVLNAIADQNNSSVVSAFQHFVEFGSEEGVVRAPAAQFETFNAQTYLAQNPDLQEAFGDLEGEALDDALFAHFVEFGVNENRPGTGVVLQPENPGQQFDLTVLANDNLVGTAGDDTFVGTTTTIQATDRVNGGAGFDTFVSVGSAGTVSGAGPVLPVLNNIEQVVFQAPTAGITADYSGNASLERLVISTSDDVNDLTVASGVTVAFDTVTGGAAQEVNFKGATTGTVEVSNGSALGAVTVGGTTPNALTSVTVASAGTASTIASIAAISGTALKTVNFEGDGDVTVASALAGVTTINAAAATGDVTVTVAAATAADGTDLNSVVTGGSGNDTFIFGESLTATDTVNGGAGFDAVVVTNDGDLSSATEAARFNNLKSIEQVIFADGGVTLDGKTFTNTEITSIQFATTGSDIVNDAGTARTYSIGEGNEGDLTLNMKAGATVANVELDGTTSTAAGADIGTLTVNLNAADLASKATINISSLEAATEGDTSGSDNVITTITAITGSTVNITGAGDISVGALTNAAVVNASSLTGQLILGGSAGADTITVGSGGSIIDAGAGADTITLGAGVDRLVLNDGDSGAITGTAPALNITGFDVITGFQAGVGGDVLDFAGSAQAGGADFDALTTAQLNEVAGAANLLAATNAALALTNDGQWTAFSFGGATYAVIGEDNAFDGATDVLVQLAGVNVTTLTAVNFDVSGA